MRPFSARVWLLCSALLAGAGTTAAAQGSSDYLQVIDESESGKLVFLIGPLNLPAKTGHHAIKQPPLQTGTVPADGYIYGFETQMVNADMRPVSDRMLHHVNLIDPDNRELFSPIARRLFAAGQETQPAQIPRWLGVPVHHGQRLNVSAMFHNPTETGYEAAYLRVTLLFRKAGALFPIAVYPVYLDVMSYIGKKDFDLPPGRYEKSWEGRPAISGRLLAVGGHLHDYAVSLRFEDVTAGKVIWEESPIVDGDGRVVAVPVGKLWRRGGLRLRSDHTYKLTVIYDNPTGETIVDGGMGAFGGIFLPGWDEEWPSLDPNDLVYRTDVKLTRRTAERRAQGMAAADRGHGHQHNQGNEMK